MKGQARSLDAAVDVALGYVQAQLSAEERADLLRFLRELTPKGAAPLGLWPDIDSNAGVYPDVRPWVAFADPVDATLGNSASEVAAKYGVLEDSQGKPVPGRVEAQGWRLEFIPAAPLSTGASYRFRVLPGLPFLSGGSQEGERSTSFTVAKAPVTAWPARMKMTVQVLGLRGITPMDFLLTPSASPRAGGLSLVLQPQLFGTQQRQELWLRVDGSTLRMQPFALPVSPTAVADAAQVTGTVTEVDPTSGEVIRAQGTLRMGGPGINVPGVVFTLQRQ